MDKSQRVAPSGGLATQAAPPFDLPFRFMAVGLTALALMALVYPWHVPLLLGSFYNPHLLAFVHVNTLGMIAAIVFGASFQLLPVVLQIPIASVRLGRLSWWLYLPGLVALIAGFSSGLTALVAIGGSFLVVAVALYVGIVAGTLIRAPHRDVVAWHIAAAATTLLIAASFGIVLALNKHFGFLSATTMQTLAAHAVLMIGGWATPMLMGVAYRLVGMFTLSEDQLRHDWAWAGLFLTSGGAWVLALSILLGFGQWPTLAGAIAILLGLGFFATQLVRLYRRRRRRTFDVHIPFALTATGFGLAAALLIVWGLASHRSPADHVWLAAGWLAIAGWIETAIQGFLYKIGTFLTWLHRYAPFAGRQRVPKLEELYGRRTAQAGWVLWSVGVFLAAVAALAAIQWLAVVAALTQSCGAIAFLVNVARVGKHWRSTAAAAPTSVAANVQPRGAGTRPQS